MPDEPVIQRGVHEKADDHHDVPDLVSNTDDEEYGSDVSAEYENDTADRLENNSSGDDAQDNVIVYELSENNDFDVDFDEDFNALPDKPSTSRY